MTDVNTWHIVGHIYKPQLKIIPECEETESKKQPKSRLGIHFTVSQVEIFSFLVLGVCSLTLQSAGNGVSEKLLSNYRVLI